MSKRSDIMNSLKTALQSSSLGLTVVSIDNKIVPIEELDFTTYPAGVIVDMEETDFEYRPGKQIESILTPQLRCLFTDRTYTTTQSFITTLKTVIDANSSLGGKADFTRFLAITTIEDPEHKFVEIRAGMSIRYQYKSDTP